jgi:hypothetical protein
MGSELLDSILGTRTSSSKFCLGNLATITGWTSLDKMQGLTLPNHILNVPMMSLELDHLFPAVHHALRSGSGSVLIVGERKAAEEVSTGASVHAPHAPHARRRNQAAPVRTPPPPPRGKELKVVMEAMKKETKPTNKLPNRARGQGRKPWWIV